MGSHAHRRTGMPPAPEPRPGSILTKAARWALTVEHASLQGLARGPAEAGVRQAGVVPALAHPRALRNSPLPAAELQPLVIDVQ